MSRNTLCVVPSICICHLISIYIYPAASLSIKPARKISTVVIHQDGESTLGGSNRPRRSTDLPSFCWPSGRASPTFVSGPRAMRVGLKPSSALRTPGARVGDDRGHATRRFLSPPPTSPSSTISRRGPYSDTLWFDIPLSPFSCGHRAGSPALVVTSPSLSSHPRGRRAAPRGT